MLISAALRYSILFGGVAIAVAGIVWLGRRAVRDDVPRAVVITAVPRSLRSAIARWLPIAVIPLGFGIAYWAWSHWREYVIVTDGDRAPNVVRRYGRDGLNDLPPAPEGYSRRDGDRGYVWVLNRSAHAVRIETTSYSPDGGWHSSQVRVPPGTSTCEFAIDNIGASDPPQFDTDGFFSSLSTDRRHWLRWDP